MDEASDALVRAGFSTVALRLFQIAAAAGGPVLLPRATLGRRWGVSGQYVGRMVAALVAAGVLRPGPEKGFEAVPDPKLWVSSKPLVSEPVVSESKPGVSAKPVVPKPLVSSKPLVSEPVVSESKPGVSGWATGTPLEPPYDDSSGGWEEEGGGGNPPPPPSGSIPEPDPATAAAAYAERLFPGRGFGPLAAAQAEQGISLAIIRAALDDSAAHPEPPRSFMPILNRIRRYHATGLPVPPAPPSPPGGGLPNPAPAAVSDYDRKIAQARAFQQRAVQEEAARAAAAQRTPTLNREQAHVLRRLVS